MKRLGNTANEALPSCDFPVPTKLDIGSLTYRTVRWNNSGVADLNSTIRCIVAVIGFRDIPGWIDNNSDTVFSIRHISYINPLTIDIIFVVISAANRYPLVTFAGTVEKLSNTRIAFCIF